MNIRYYTKFKCIYNGNLNIYGRIKSEKQKYKKYLPKTTITFVFVLNTNEKTNKKISQHFLGSLKLAFA